ncbi:HNH endonuclease [Leptolyngbya cf. ectocarpi LEGE 11479]|uniref:HNH endonuclease n=1 Tax=Leptolyngbya cf. ectocarpi LEGE 11479 TaxID=1828722 RepID=A0A928ZWD4_LEPEC|nr:HNH endonuclease signature motif containing protein [Leptolyngbya ectocarpi]MBE9068717.1 HNH endonuclease [Leptolyngbya cf. ectocarpi LEGE 11479]
MPMDRSLYPDNWDELAFQIKTEANWCCTECGRPCRQPGESFDTFLKRCWTPSLEMRYPSYEMDGERRVSKAGRFVLTVAHIDHEPGNCDLTNLKALCAPCHGTYDLKQMGRKRVLKAERNGQLRTDDILNGAQLALLSELVVYQRLDPRSGGRRTMVRKPLDAVGSKRKHRAPGNASGWIEERLGNRKRANPSVSYYYRWDSPKGRVSEYIRASQVTRVARMIEAERPALEILRIVVEGKRKISGVSVELLR